MMDLLDINKKIRFEEERHKYFLGTQELLSATTLLGVYKEPFDPSGFLARRCAERDGITTEEILKKWGDKNIKACAYGHAVHSEVEHFLTTKEIRDTPHKDIVLDFSKIKFTGKIYPELRLMSNKYLIAGTCDIAQLNKDKVIIHDLKTNERFDIKSKYGNKFKYPLDNLSECHLTSYSLQILIYGEMVKEHGFKFEPGHILWVNPKTRKIEKYDVLDLSKEVKKLLNHYKSILEW